MDRIKCFVVEPAHTTSWWLRRFTFSSEKKCPATSWGHDAMSKQEYCSNADDPKQKWFCTKRPEVPRDHAMWPTKCDHCDYVFQDEDQWQEFGEPIFLIKNSGTYCLQKDLPPGALYRMECYEDEGPDGMNCGFDGQSWACKLPGGHVWNIDGEANNCTRKGDKTHRCWVRQGVAPDFNIDKNGPTCSAGAGSILVPEWHGFLRNGWLEQC